MISFLFFCEKRIIFEYADSNIRMSSYFRKDLKKPLVYRAAAGAPFHPVRSAERTCPPPHGERKATHHAEAGLPSEPPPSIISA